MDRSVTAPPNDWRPPRLAWHGLGGVVQTSRGARKIHHHHVWAQRSLLPQADIVNFHVSYPCCSRPTQTPMATWEGKRRLNPGCSGRKKLWRPSTDSRLGDES